MFLAGAETFTFKTVQEYKAAPIKWGGLLATIRWTGSERSRQTALDKLRHELERTGHPWTSVEAWSTGMITAYKGALTTCYPAEAIRLLLALHGKDPVGNKPVLVDRCVEHTLPLSTPADLIEIHRQITALALTADSAPDIASGADNAALLAELQGKYAASQKALIASNKALNASAGSAPAGPAGMPDWSAMMSGAITAALSAVKQHENGTGATKPKGPTGWKQVLAGAVGKLKERTVVNSRSLKLSRANKERVTKETKSNIASRTVSLGNNMDLVLPDGVSANDRAGRGRDSPFTNGLSGLFRLLSTMANQDEESFSRQSLQDFLGLWAEIWDSRMGTRTQKVKCLQAFYEEHAETLGDGTWLKEFSANSHFLIQELGGTHTDCGACGGSGGARESTKGGKPDTTGDHGRGRKGDGGGRGGGGGGGHKRPRQEPICKSMIDKRVGLCSAPTCRFTHSPCPACGGKCKSAAACTAWDQAKIDRQFGNLLGSLGTTPKKRK